MFHLTFSILQNGKESVEKLYISPQYRDRALLRNNFFFLKQCFPLGKYLERCKILLMVGLGTNSQRILTLKSLCLLGFLIAVA